MKEKIIRYNWFIVGIVINSFGIAFITKSALGTSQISSIPYVMSLQFDKISFGMWTFILNMLFIIGQMVLLGKEFHPIQILQIPANVVFSWLIDVSMKVLGAFQPEKLCIKLPCLIAGCFLLALGIAIEVAPDVITVPGEGIVRVIAKVSGKRFGTVKVYFDVILIVIAAILSFVFFGKLQGIGIGTVISAIVVGRFVNFINHCFPLIRMIRAE